MTKSAWRKPGLLLIPAMATAAFVAVLAVRVASAQDAPAAHQQPAPGAVDTGEVDDKNPHHKQGKKSGHPNSPGQARKNQEVPPEAHGQAPIERPPAKKRPPINPTMINPNAPPRPPAVHDGRRAAPVMTPGGGATLPPPSKGEKAQHRKDKEPHPNLAQPPPANKKKNATAPLPDHGPAPMPGQQPKPAQTNAPDMQTPGKTGTFKKDAVQKPAFHNLDQLRSKRTERRENGGKRVVIQEGDKRVIVRDGNRLVIQKDEAQQLKRIAPNARTTRNASGLATTVVQRPNGVQIVTETDANGQLVRRYRRDRNGREAIIIDNRRRHSSFGRDLAIGVGVGVGVAAGAAILNSIVDVPPPRVRLPRDKYVVDYDHASEDDVYEALSAPPVDEIDGRYTLDQVRATRYLRERMRRIDLDDINFATGSWDVDPSQYHKLERIARAMRRIIRHNENEVFMVEGYTDAVGSDIDNLALSDRRAESVADILSQEFNVPFENLVTQGYGEQYLKIDTSGPERANRRVAVRRITPLIAGYRGGPRVDDDEPGPPPRHRPRYDDRDVDPY
jgi:outer membrane protein OmpA-like peptidoglycan-associated protein